ncbi:MAG TPA: DUF4336 domain-containing protein [Gemmatimonadota bacterium]|nr:DUF4336 domain-containing protein [Gemmatimonadota bacterium]
MPASSDPTPVFTRALAEGLWVAEHPMKAMGMELGRRMTVVRLEGGRLWLHSVGRLTTEVAGWLDSLGRVAFVVSPSRTHRRWMEAYAAAYPDAALVASPGLPRKRPDLAFDRTLGDLPEPEWAGELDQAVFPIRGDYREVVFLHRPSRTLILTDLCFHVPAGRGLVTTALARAFGYYERLAVSRLLRMLLADRPAARDALERILTWDFDRVIIGHGRITETGGKPALETAFAWLLKGQRP